MYLNCDRPQAGLAPLAEPSQVSHVWLCGGEVFLIGLFYLRPFIRLSQRDQVAVPRLTRLCIGELWFWK